MSDKQRYLDAATAIERSIGTLHTLQEDIQMAELDNDFRAAQEALNGALSKVFVRIGMIEHYGLEQVENVLKGRTDD